MAIFRTIPGQHLPASRKHFLGNLNFKIGRASLMGSRLRECTLVFMLTQVHSLPRKRGRVQTEFAAR